MKGTKKNCRRVSDAYPPPLLETVKPKQLACGMR